MCFGRTECTCPRTRVPQALRFWIIVNGQEDISKIMAERRADWRSNSKFLVAFCSYFLLASMFPTAAIASLPPALPAGECQPKTGIHRHQPQWHIIAPMEPGEDGTAWPMGLNDANAVFQHRGIFHIMHQCDGVNLMGKGVVSDCTCVCMCVCLCVCSYTCLSSYPHNRPP